ncbi:MULTISPECIES: SSI family serine proteinase inhibitor [unclassified Micromonospora]|uniref:SSI family serine proteinase inhibitor n=1 Tax=unclassified Micromonospora TaxID=2617518 RepID=UPI002FEE9D64
MPLARRAAVAATAAALTVAGLTAQAALLPQAAQAAPRSGAESPSVLLLAVDRAGTAEDRSSVLVCGPTGGTHPDAATACRTLAHVDGNLAALSVDPGPCTFEYAPVTVHAWGFWQDRPVAWSETYSNRCMLLRGTGALFAF